MKGIVGNGVEMERVVSRDGTEIAFAKSGTGPPLVLVHGAAGDHERWGPVLPPLEARFTVYAVDRRGRGESGDGPEYSIEREFEDVAAVVDSIGERVKLLGHSLGALCSLEASLLTDNISQLVLHEPPVSAFGEVPAELVTRFQRYLDAGDPEGLLITFMRELVKLPEEDIEAIRRQPLWPRRVAAAHTIPREMAASYTFEPERFAKMSTPTLLLLGSESMPFDAVATYEVHHALPNSRISFMQGVEHVAIYRDPALWVREVLEFLSKDEPAERRESDKAAVS